MGCCVNTNKGKRMKNISHSPLDTPGIEPLAFDVSFYKFQLVGI